MFKHRCAHCSEGIVKCYHTTQRRERRTWRYMALNDLTGSNGGQTGSSGQSCFHLLLFFFFSAELFPQRDAVCPRFGGKKIFPTALISLPHMTSSHFQCFTCKNVLIRYKKSKQSVFLLFASVQFCIEKYVCFLKSSYFFLFIYFLYIPDVFVVPELISICGYMCWASIMSKYLASMI